MDGQSTSEVSYSNVDIRNEQPEFITIFKYSSVIDANIGECKTSQKWC